MKRTLGSCLSVGLLSSSFAVSTLGADKDTPALPTSVPPSTNAPIQYLKYMKESDQTTVPLLQRPFPEIMVQRVHERISDSFVPQTLTFATTSQSAYETLTREIRDNLMGGLRRAGRDALTIGLNNLELRNRPLVDALPLFYGTAEGMDGRLLRDPASVYTFGGDSQFTPRHEAPRLTLGFEPWRANPYGHATYAFREGTRVLRARTTYERGEFAFDSVGMPNIRIGITADYFALKERSQGFISTTLPGRVNLGIGSTAQGTWNVTASFTKRF